MRHHRIVTLICLLVVVAGASYFLYREGSATRTEAAKLPTAALEASHLFAAAKPAHEKSNAPAIRRAVAVSKPAPLPPPGTPLKDIYADLASRARSGDRAASVRLFHDTAKCQYAQVLRHRLSLTVPTILRVTAPSTLKPSTLDSAEAVNSMLDVYQTDMDWLNKIEPMCEGLDDEEAQSSINWMQLSAEQGDHDSIDCYLDLDFVHSGNVIQHLQWLSDFQQVAPAMASRAIGDGDWKVAAQLQLAYDGNGMTNWLGEIVTPDPIQAYRYAYLLTLGGENNGFLKERIQALEGQLAESEVVASKTWAKETFTKDFHGDPMASWELHTICPNPQAWPD